MVIKLGLGIYYKNRQCLLFLFSFVHMGNICSPCVQITQGVGADWRESAYIFPLIGINFKSINDKVALLYIYIYIT